MPLKSVTLTNHRGETFARPEDSVIRKALIELFDTTMNPASHHCQLECRYKGGGMTLFTVDALGNATCLEKHANKSSLTPSRYATAEIASNTWIEFLMSKRTDNNRS